MKRTCYGCRAFYQSQMDLRCELGYAIESVFDQKLGIHTVMRPKKDCPKPRTSKELVNLQLNESRGYYQ